MHHTTRSAQKVAPVVFVVLDDFYHLRIEDQSKVLDYLSRLFKNSVCYLKFSSISHRTSLYRSDSTIIEGLQIGHDVQDINLDRSFKSFHSVDTFLKEFRRHLCKRAGIDGDIDTLFRGEAWHQLVLASGGVPRDFINVLVKAIEVGRRRPDCTKLEQRLIHEASYLYYKETKQEDLKKDSDLEASELERLLRDLRDFCVELRRKNVFLVPVKELESAPDVEENLRQLCDFRFLHEIHENVSRAGTTDRFRAFLLDVGLYAYPQKRGANRVQEVAFWKKGERSRLDELRQAPIYHLKDDYSAIKDGVLEIESEDPSDSPKATSSDDDDDKQFSLDV